MPADFELPVDLDPETTLICTECSTEYSARFDGTSCADCGGQLMALDGTLVEQLAEPAINDQLGYGAAEGSLQTHVYEDDVVFQPFATDNPYMQRLFEHELFGRVPEGCRGLVAELSSAHPDERLLTAMRVRHGQRESGFLMVTTHFLRYVKAGRVITVLKKDEFWPLHFDIESEGVLGPGVIRTMSGHQFQIWGMKAKRFRDFYQLAQLALAWESTEASTERQVLQDAAAVAAVLSVEPSQAVTGLAAEIANLAQLRDQGVLSEDEFVAAKQKLLRS